MILTIAWPLLSAALGAAGLLCAMSPPRAESVEQTTVPLNVEQLGSADIARLDAILQRLESLITAKKRDGTANLLKWDDLYRPLSSEERAFLDVMRTLNAEQLGATNHYFGETQDPLELVPVGPERVMKAGASTLLDPQYLPRDVHAAYAEMMEAMNRELGKRLFVESGYRSPAYQLYLFLFYLPKHDHSIRETNRHVALPGHSEHGYPPRQAIDFINQDGINGEDHPEEFEQLPEYRWLLAHAPQFGFHLSYPRNNATNTAFEPWHWHFEKPSTVDGRQSVKKTVYRRQSTVHSQEQPVPIN